MNEITVPGRGERPAFAIVYDHESDCVVIDGVKFAPEVLLEMTKPDPNPSRWVRFERREEAVVAHVKFEGAE
jgi:hypothetical protein